MIPKIPEDQEKEHHPLTRPPAVALSTRVTHLPPVRAACTAWTGEPVSAEGQQLAWVSGEELESYDMPAADVPLIPPVQRAAAEAVAKE